MITCRSCGWTSEDPNEEHSCAGCKLDPTNEDKSTFSKADNDKPRMELLDPEYLIGTAQVLTFGAAKYDTDNWKKATDKDIARIRGAMLRHMMAHSAGEVIDTDSGLNHMYHVSCNAMFLAYFDRPRLDTSCGSLFAGLQV